MSHQCRRAVFAFVGAVLLGAFWIGAFRFRG
jgi:hypothetical protein